jgi:hypothetical protein
MIDCRTLQGNSAPRSRQNCMRLTHQNESPRGLPGGLYIDSETNKADHIEEQLLHYSDLDAIFRHTGMTGETLTGDDVKKIHEILLEKGLTPDMLLAIRKFDIDPASFSNDLKYRAKFVAWYEGISSFIRGVAREYVASLE